MRITKTQLAILRTIQSNPVMCNAEIAERLGLACHKTVVDELNQFAKDNGMVGYRWFLERIKDYDLSALKLWRERRGAMGIFWSTERQRWVAKYNRHFIGSFLFRDDAIEAREKYIASLV